MSTKSQKGFSLVELMVVIAILGVLSALAVTQFRTFKVRAARTEAMTNMTAIYALLEGFTAERGFDPYDAALVCGGSNLLGASITNCTQARYNYFFQVEDDATSGVDKFEVRAIEYTWGAPLQRRVLTWCDHPDSELEAWGLASNNEPSIPVWGFKRMGRFFSGQYDALAECSP
jgi:prepilin-type N-terminal cleavage/methylation domain-containing protein